MTQTSNPPSDRQALPDLPGLRSLGSAEPFAAEVCAALARAQPFSVLSPDEARVVCGFMTVHAAEAGTRLFDEGDPADFLLVVVQGEVELLRRNRNQFAAQVAIAGTGESVGEMSLFDGAPRFSSCVALEPARVAVLTRAGLDALTARDPALAARLFAGWSAMLSGRLRDVSARLFLQLEAARAA